MFHLGATRTSIQPNHALITPDSFVRAPLPGMVKASAIVHTSPTMGASFTQYTAELESSGQLGICQSQRFVYVLEGEAAVETPQGSSRLGPCGFAYLPAGTTHTIKAVSPAKLSVIEKPYSSLPGAASPRLLHGEEQSIEPELLNGDEDLLVRKLLPDSPEFDFAVNTMTYQPGASLPMVECHVMEHGLLMLEGSGIYRLGHHWYPVTAGDFIWMGPYCPQWFGALGKVPARYLIYKDWNRHPLQRGL